MQAPEPGQHPKDNGCMIAFVVVFLIAILAALALPVFSKISPRGNMTIAIGNCRLVITTMKLYASDNNGRYPDEPLPPSGPGQPSLPPVHTSNEAFRRMFIGGQATDEKIFGSPFSLYSPDGNIGTAPSYPEALKPGENHWALMGGLNEATPGHIPLVFETPLLATLPPQWTRNVEDSKPVKGRTWSGRKVVVGMNDGSVSSQSTYNSFGHLLDLKPSPTPGKPNPVPGKDKNVFDAALELVPLGTLKILDVE